MKFYPKKIQDRKMLPPGLPTPARFSVMPARGVLLMEFSQGDVIKIPETLLNE